MKMHLILGGLRERIASNGAQGAVVVDDPAKAGTVVSRILDACFSIVGQNLLFGHGEFNLSRKTLRQSCLVCHHESKQKCHTWSLKSGTSSGYWLSTIK